MTDRTTSDLPIVVTTVAELRARVAAARAAGKRIGLVPTMGALHEGHLSLARAANTECDFTIVTIFVNPTQFGPGEDFNRYPRVLVHDLQLLSSVGVDLVFAPEQQEMYPAGSTTFVEVAGLTAQWEGAVRPQHFRGVTTIVAKLFNAAAADVAYFGQKDYQQVTVIRRMVADLNMPIEIRVCPIVRDADGLALSSRNAYLSDDERRRALVLSRSLHLANKLVEQGETDTAKIVAAMRACVESEPGVVIDYVAVVDGDTLEPVESLRDKSSLHHAVAIVAARVGTTRLIDNVILE